MARGNNKRGRGGPSPGPRGGAARGSSTPRGRGAGRGRGRGGRGRGAKNGYIPFDEFDLPIPLYDNSPRGGFAGRARGNLRGRGNAPRRAEFASPLRGSAPSTPTRGTRNRGRGGKMGSYNAPLSSLLYEERPLLRPIVFVRSTLTATLFQEEEEIFEPGVEEIDDLEASHVPTASRVNQVFHIKDDDEDEGDDEEELEEIDFADIGKFQEKVDAGAVAMTAVKEVEERFTGIHIGKGGQSESTEVVMQETTTSVVEPTADVVLDATSPNAPVEVHDQAMEDAEVPEPAASPPAEASSVAVETTEAAHMVIDLVTGPDASVPGGAPIMEKIETSEVTEVAREEPTFFIDTTPAPAGISQAPVDTTSESVAFAPDVEVQAPFYVDINPAAVEPGLIPLEDADAPTSAAASQPSLASVPEDQPTFFIDSTPSTLDVPTTVPSRIAQLTSALQDEDEVIVYVAPHPRSTRSTPAPPAPVLPPMTSMLTGTTTTLNADALPTPKPSAPGTPTAVPSAPGAYAARQGTRQPRHALAMTPDGRARTRIRERQKQKKRRGGGRPKGEWGALGFGAFGAMHEDELWAPDPRYAERRRGDSDLEWGTDDEEEEGGTGVAEGMEVDGDLAADEGAMRRFVRSMGVEGQTHVTMDDIRDGEILRAEDEEVTERGSESESSEDDEGDLEAALNQEEAEMLGESEDEDSDDSDDLGDSPGTSFRKRLERMRAAKGKQRARALEVVNESDDDDEQDIASAVDDYDAMEWSNADADEAFLDHVDALLAENRHLLKGKGKKRHDKLFNNILNGSFDIDDGLDELAQLNNVSASKRRKDKHQNLSAELQEQWEKDRAKKAANKRARQLARMQVAADPLAPKRGGKKMKKAIAAVARHIEMAYSDDEDLPGTVHVIPNRVIDMTTLVMQIRRFIDDIGRTSMSLPPANKDTRKKVHELANAFGLKSESKGKGEARFTTLKRTSRTGYTVNERKIARIVRGAGGQGGMFGSSSFEKGKKGKATGSGVRVPRHREGEEVGGHAPKIGETNVGFRMLAMMGWQDGQRIGVSGGLDAPVAAIMKTTKLGLGATM